MSLRVRAQCAHPLVEATIETEMFRHNRNKKCFDNCQQPTHPESSSGSRSITATHVLTTRDRDGVFMYRPLVPIDPNYNHYNGIQTPDQWGIEYEFMKYGRPLSTCGPDELKAMGSEGGLPLAKWRQSLVDNKRKRSEGKPCTGLPDYELGHRSTKLESPLRFTTCSENTYKPKRGREAVEICNKIGFPRLGAFANPMQRLWVSECGTDIFFDRFGAQ